MFLVSFEDTATTDLSTYGLTLSLHDALPILLVGGIGVMGDGDYGSDPNILDTDSDAEEYIALAGTRGFEAPEIGRAHVCTPVTNAQLGCRLLLEKKRICEANKGEGPTTKNINRKQDTTN